MITFDFSGKVVLVSGSTHGIGYITARKFLEAGAKVMLTGSTQERLDRALGTLGDLAERAAGFRADVRRRAEVEALFQALLARWGRIDILVNNAGGSKGASGPVTGITEEGWDQVIEVNMKGTFLLSQLAARQMIAQGGGGKIVNTASGSYKSGRPGAAAYCAAKAGVAMFTAVLAQELGPHGINVNCVSPGVVDVGREMTPARATYQEAQVRMTPMGRVGKPEEIAHVTMMLCSPQAEWVTGQVVGVDGGLSLGRYGLPMAL